MRRTMKFALLGLAFLTLCGFSQQQATTAFGQPVDERKAQDALQKSHDPMWATLTQTKIAVDEAKGLYTPTYPDAVKALVGKPVTISGFILPLDATEKFSHFILSKRTPTCPFCPPGEPNEIVDVWMDKPIAWSENMVKISGTFELIDDKELGMFFKLTKGREAVD